MLTIKTPERCELMFSGGLEKHYGAAWVNWRKMDIFKLNNSSIKLSFYAFPKRHLLVQSQQWNHQKNNWNLFKIKNTDTRTMSMTSFWCLYCQLWTDFTHCSDIFIFNFEQVNIDWKILLHIHDAAQSRPFLPVCTAFCIPPARPVWKPVMIYKYIHVRLKRSCLEKFLKNIMLCKFGKTPRTTSLHLHVQS